MNYIVWQKGEFAEDWHRYDADNENELTALILERARKEGELVVTVPIEYTISVKVTKPPAEVVPVVVSKVKRSKEEAGKEKIDEVSEGRPPADKVA